MRGSPHKHLHGAELMKQGGTSSCTRAQAAFVEHAERRLPVNERAGGSVALPATPEMKAFILVRRRKGGHSCAVGFSDVRRAADDPRKIKMQEGTRGWLRLS